LRRVISASSTEERGIFHWKDESLAGEGYHRLHILAGESLCSHEAMWLKVATTALVVAMIEARLLGDDFPLLRNPLGAIRRFARDPECKARAMGARDGRYWTAVRIQRAYLEAAEAHLDHPVMPAWAPQACARWRAMLDRLEQGAAGVCTTLDWAIKLELFRRQVKRQGLAWESIPVWNQALVSLERARRRCPRSARPRTLDVNLLAARSPVAGEVAEIGKFLQQHQLSWDQFEAVLAVRHKLFEIDARYGELGGQGIFASLDRAGVLAHRVEGVDRIEEAMVAPPAGCRATLRGQCIRRFYRDRLNYCCDWDGVWDFRTTRFLDLSDPFQREEQWTALWEPEPPYHLMEAAFDVDSQAQDLFRRGELAEARPLADMVRAYRGPVDGGFHEHAASIAARIHARLGLLDGAAILDEFRGRRDTLEGILDYVEVFRFRGLAPAPEAYTWMGRGLDLLAAQPEEPKGYLAAACCENQAYLLAAKGRLDVARRLLADLCKEEEPIEPTLPLLARARAVLGEILRRMGLLVEAREQLDQARQLQEENGLLGDLAAFTLTALAKLPGDQSAALERLGRAKELQVRQGDPVGEARTLLLEARLCTERRRLPAIRERLEELGRTVPALGCCPLFTSLMSRWDEWTARRHEPDSRGDPFWGL